MPDPTSAESVPRPLPWWDRWRVLAPFTAPAWLLLFASAWQQRPGKWAFVALGAAAWAFGLVAVVNRTRLERDRLGKLLLALVCTLVASWGALRWLPSALVAMSAPVIFLSAFQAVVTLGRHSRHGTQAALVLAAAGAFFVLTALPLAWPPMVRGGLLVALCLGVIGALRSPERLHFSEHGLGAARGVAFAAGVLLPIAWTAPGGLIQELQRSENLAFAALALLVGAGVGHARALAGHEGNAAWPISIYVPLGATLTLLSWWLSLQTWPGPSKPILIAIGCCAGAFTGVAVLAKSLGRGLALWLEVTLLAAWGLAPWVAHWTAE